MAVGPGPGVGDPARRTDGPPLRAWERL